MVSEFTSQNERQARSSKPPQPNVSTLPEYPPSATRLSTTASIFFILLLWLPRFFVPWITAWNEFNEYILSNPYHWQHRQGELDKQELYAFFCGCFIALLFPVVFQKFQDKFDLFEHCLYFVLLFLFTLTPTAGQISIELLNEGFVDDPRYTDWWFTSVVVVRWMMVTSFAMLPIQFACIYAQNNSMSRDSHYNWTAVFVFLEFLNASSAFWTIPPNCPTKEWGEMLVWGEIELVLITVLLLTLIHHCLVSNNSCIYYWLGIKPADPFLSPSLDLMKKKFKWCTLILLPIELSHFSFAVLGRLTPDEDWDEHDFWSATSMFYFGRRIGVVVMVMIMFAVHRWLKHHPKISKWRAEMFYLGVPHAFGVIALLTLVGRFTALSHLSPGDVIAGPIPDEQKTVLLIFNTIFRNRTICVSSEYFKPVRIRPWHHATRELYDIAVSNFTCNVTVDPCFDAGLQTHFVVDNFTKGDWVVYGITLPRARLGNEDTLDYYSRLMPIRFSQVERLRPKGVPQIALFSYCRYFPLETYYHQLYHSGRIGIETYPANTIDPYVETTIELFREPRLPVILDIPATGAWSATTRPYNYNWTRKLKAWYENSTYKRNMDEFIIENFSLYYLLEYDYKEVLPTETLALIYPVGTPPKVIDRFLPKWRYDGSHQGFKLFKVAETAGPDGGQLPGKTELQHDWAIKLSLTLAGMAAGGLFLGFIYLFWVDPPVPKYRSTTMAVCWVLMGVAALIPRNKLVDVVSIAVSAVLLVLQLASTAMHFIGAYFMYNSSMDFRQRVD